MAKGLVGNFGLLSFNLKGRERLFEQQSILEYIFLGKQNYLLNI